MKPPTCEAVLAAMKAKSYVVFTKPYDLNVIGLRAIPGTPNVFDDLLCVIYNDGKTTRMVSWPCTTDPGTFYLQNPIHVSGTAVLAAAQNRGAFTFGKHRGAYECLVQAGNVLAYLDTNKDTKADETGKLRTLSPNANIHIHRASATRTSSRVDKWSAGCCVVASPVDFQAFLTLCHKQVEHGLGDTFTYTLLDWPTTG